MRLTCLIGIVLLLGCGSRPAPSSMSAARPQQSAAALAPSPSPTAPPSAAPPPAPPPERSLGPFYVVSTGAEGDPLMSARLGDKLFIRNYVHLVEVRGDELVAADSLLTGLPGVLKGNNSLEQLLGYWPHATFASVNHCNNFSSRAPVYFWIGVRLDPDLRIGRASG